MPGTDGRTPWQADRDRDRAEATGKWPSSWGPFHRHFANDAVHRDGGPECDQPGTPRRVYVFDPDYLDEHERAVAAYAAQHPEQFAPPRPDGPHPWVRAALDEAASAGLVVSWREIPGRGAVVIAGDMAEWELRTDREAALFCGALAGALCAIRDGKAGTGNA